MLNSFSAMKRITVTTLSFFVLANAVHAQSNITGSGANISAPAKGTTDNLSVTNGSRTSLAVGNTSSFGASTNLSASAGLAALSRSVLIPSTIEVNSSIGSNPNKTGVTLINISNLTAKGGGTVVPGNQGGLGQGTTLTSTDGQFASGDALIDGMGASVNMRIGESVNSPDSEASFYAIVHPHIQSGTTCSEPTSGLCQYTPGALSSGNASASANLGTQTTIDINASNFTQTFAQSF